MRRLGLWLCRHGWHQLVEPGNCTRCGFRYHGGHVGDAARWWPPPARHVDDPPDETSFGSDVAP